MSDEAPEEMTRRDVMEMSQVMLHLMEEGKNDFDPMCMSWRGAANYLMAANHLNLAFHHMDLSLAEDANTRTYEGT
jgi:hypothetical protein